MMTVTFLAVLQTRSRDCEQRAANKPPYSISDGEGVNKPQLGIVYRNELPPPSDSLILGLGKMADYLQGLLIACCRR